MSELRFTEDHEWVRAEPDGSVRLGVTDYAQEQLGDVVYVELPEAGKHVTAGDEVVMIESVKAAGEVKTPVTGEVITVNEELSDSPELVNNDAFGDGWMITIRPEDPRELDELLDEDAYREYIAGL